MKRNLKCLLQAILLVGLVVGAWYGQSRLLAPMRAVEIQQLSTPTVQEEDVSGLTLAAYNIAHGRGGEVGASNWTGNTKDKILNHLAAIAARIVSNGVDILVLNEVDLDSTWSRRINQAEAIAEKAEFPWCASQRNMDVSLPFRRYCFGNAVLSKFPITEARRIPFPAMSMKERILAGNHDGLLVRISTPMGEIALLAVHLEYRSEDIRVECARIIEGHSAISQVPLIAIGDFNSSPAFAKGHEVTADGENAVDNLLGSGLFKVAEKAMGDDYLTFPSGDPTRAIDWILCSPSLELTGTQAVESRLSDHLMIVGQVKMAQGSETGPMRPR